MDEEEEEYLRSGAWNPQEIAYATRLIDEFRNGSLQIPEGTSMRGFLATKLCCDPKRISKKVSWHWYCHGNNEMEGL